MHDDTEEKVAESVFVAFCFVPCLFAGWRDVHISGNDAAYRCFKGGGIGRNERKHGKDTGNELVLSGEGGWTGSFDHLNRYQDGKEIVYTIAEDPVDGYTTAIEGDAKAGFIVTNTGTDTPDQPKEQKNRTPNGSNTSSTSKTGSPRNRRQQHASRLFVAFAAVSGGNCGSSAEGQKEKEAMIRDIW